MKTRKTFPVVMTALTALVIAACGSSYSGGPPPPYGTPVISAGTVTAKASITVNGIKFEDTSANITADDSTKSSAFLQTGMTVKVKGRRNDDGVTGTADRIEVENEVRGPVAALAGDRFTVHGQAVVVHAGTILDGGITFSGGAISGLADGENVEVHGQRLADGTIVATRVEKLTGVVMDEVKGIVSGLVLNTSFNIGALAITYDSTTPILPAGAAIADGALVEVHLGPGNAATRIEIEDAEDGEFRPGEGQEIEVEGFVSGFTAHPGDFQVAGQTVRTTVGTRFEGGISDDLVNNARVEAEGHMIGGVLVADKIKFKDTVRIESNAQSASGGSAPSSFTVLGKTVLITSATELNNITLPIGINGGVKIRGFVNTDGTITATRIDGTGGVAADRHILQGPVSSFDASARTLVILSITVEASGAGVVFEDGDDNPIADPAVFFALLTANRSIVKARGTAANPMIANDVSIE